MGLNDLLFLLSGEPRLTDPTPQPLLAHPAPIAVSIVPRCQEERELRPTEAEKKMRRGDMGSKEKVWLRRVCNRGACQRQ